MDMWFLGGVPGCTSGRICLGLLSLFPDLGASADSSSSSFPFLVPLLLLFL